LPWHLLELIKEQNSDKIREMIELLAELKRRKEMGSVRFDMCINKETKKITKMAHWYWGMGRIQRITCGDEERFISVEFRIPYIVPGFERIARTIAEEYEYQVEQEIEELKNEIYEQLLEEELQLLRESHT